MTEMKNAWILASGSPRRREILGRLGLTFSVITADTDEDSTENNPVRLVEELAARKASAVRDKLAREGTLPPDHVILAADTIVVSPDGEILGKPHDRADAVRMLHALSGRTHRVISGVAVARAGRVVASHEITEVSFAALSDETIDRYVTGGEPMDKAGAYGYQATASLWVTGISGDYFNVVGLPVHRLETLLGESFGLSLWTEEQTI